MDDILKTLTVEQLRGIYTMVEFLPTPTIGSRETSEGIQTIKKIVVEAFCRKCTRAGIHKDRRGYKVCDEHLDQPLKKPS